MSIVEEAREALDLKTLNLPPIPRLERLEVEDYLDTTGVPSLRLLAVMEESTELNAVTGRDIADMKFAIRERLRERGISRFAYISFAKPSELVESHDEEQLCMTI